MWWNIWQGPPCGTMTSIVPYKLFAVFVAIGKVSPRRDEGIAPYSRVGHATNFMMAYAVMRRNGQDRSLQFGFMFVPNFKMLYL